METFWQFIFGLAILCVFSSSVRVALVGLGHPPANSLLLAATHDGWNLSLILFMPMLLGEFARQEMSPMPWAAYAMSAARHGPIDGLTGAALVIIVELWIFWNPAQTYIKRHHNIDHRIIILARALNISIGLLLVTPNNPIYMFISLF